MFALCFYHKIIQNQQFISHLRSHKVSNEGLDEGEFLREIVKIGMLFELLMALSLAAIPIVMYPVVKKHSKRLGITYIATRVIEGLFYLIDIALVLSLAALGKEYVKAGAPVDSYFNTLAEVMLHTRDYMGHVLLDIAVFGVAALVLYAI